MGPQEVIKATAYGRLQAQMREQYFTLMCWVSVSKDMTVC